MVTTLQFFKSRLVTLLVLILEFVAANERYLSINIYFTLFSLAETIFCESITRKFSSSSSSFISFSVITLTFDKGVL